MSKNLPQPFFCIHPVLMPLKGEGRTDFPRLSGERLITLLVNTLLASRCLKLLLSDFSVPRHPTNFHSGGRREGLALYSKCLILFFLLQLKFSHVKFLMSQSLIKQCTLEGGALAQAVRMTRLLCDGSLAGLCSLETPLSLGFRSPEIFASHSQWDLVF